MNLLNCFVRKPNYSDRMKNDQDSDLNIRVPKKVAGGGATGAVLGAVIAGPVGAVVGGAVGALVGSAVGKNSGDDKKTNARGGAAQKPQVKQMPSKSKSSRSTEETQKSKSSRSTTRSSGNKTRTARSPKATAPRTKGKKK